MSVPGSATRFLFTDEPPALTPLRQWLPELVDDIAIVTGTARVEAFRGVCAEVHGVADYLDDGAFYATARRVLAGRARPPRALGHVGEADVERCALLREELGLPGLHHAQSRCLRDRVLMKQRLAAVLPTPRCERVDSAATLLAFAATVGLPVVLKPLAGRGAAVPAMLISDVDALPSPAAAMQVEEYVEGRLYHVEGLMRSGRLLAAAAARCDGGPVPTRRAPLVEGPRHAALIELARRAVRGLPHTGLTLFHLEAIERPGSELVFCDFAVGLGGPAVHTALSATLGTDVLRLWLADQLGDSAALPAVETP